MARRSKHLTIQDARDDIIGYYAGKLRIRTLAVPCPWTFDTMGELILGRNVFASYKTIMASCEANPRTHVFGAFPFTSMGAGQTTVRLSDKAIDDLRGTLGGGFDLAIISLVTNNQTQVPSLFSAAAPMMHESRNYAAFLKWAAAHIKINMQNVAATQLIREVVNAASSWQELDAAWPTFYDDLLYATREEGGPQSDKLNSSPMRDALRRFGRADPRQHRVAPHLRHKVTAGGAKAGLLIQQANSMSPLVAKCREQEIMPETSVLVPGASRNMLGTAASPHVVDIIK